MVVAAEAAAAAAAEAEAAAALFSEVQVSHQRHYDGVVFPPILSPNRDFPLKCGTDLSSFLEAIEAHKPWLESRLREAGAILFRGFPVGSASDFERVVEAFGFEEFPYVGGIGLRSKVLDRIVTASDAPPHLKIPFHHEMAHAIEFPSKLIFFCEVKPSSGGETPIALSHVIYQRMKERHPEFVQQLDDHGLVYSRFLVEDDDTSSAFGRGWKSMLATDDKTVAEQRAAEKGMKLEWLEDGVRTTMGPLPATRFDRIRQRQVWFNSMIGSYTGPSDTRNDPTKCVMFGDGRYLPADIVYDCQKILEEESVAIPWEDGDVLLVDNWAVLHARRSFVPPRRVLASLCK
ncbi:hypothetical protein Dimus_036736 [Dionaea muscipula]